MLVIVLVIVVVVLVTWYLVWVLLHISLWIAASVAEIHLRASLIEPWILILLVHRLRSVLLSIVDMIFVEMTFR